MIVIEGLTKEFDDGRVRAVDGLDLKIESGYHVNQLGPSGCGKTTTLRSVAGLETPTAGRIQIGGTLAFSSAEAIAVPPNKRNVGMVFQSYAIWPHMTVFENVAYPLENTGLSKSEVKERVMATLALVGLDDLAERAAPNLSGGQQQRVALARALAPEPEVLLLDEPLSNLDAKLREVMRQEIREIQQRLGITTLYVTHDQTEALAISDTVAVMKHGRIEDIGSPQRLYEAPSNRFVADFIGLANIIDVDDATTTEGGTVYRSGELGEIQGPGDASTAGARVEALFVRLEDVQLTEPAGPSSGPNSWQGKLVSSLFLGTHFDCVIQVGDQRFRAQVPRTAFRFRVGNDVRVTIPPSRCVPLESPPSRPAEPSANDDKPDRHARSRPFVASRSGSGRPANPRSSDG